MMATATSDVNGAVAVPLDLDDLVRLFRARRATDDLDQRRPTLHALAMREGAVVGRTSVTCSIAELIAGDVQLTLRLDGVAAPTSCEYVARGHVLLADGAARTGAVVELVRHGLRSESVLATGTSSIDGAFELRYRISAPCDPASPGITLSLRARVGADVVAQSIRYCNAPAELEVTLVVGGGPLRGPAIMTSIERAVADRLDGIALQELTADDVESLACATRGSARELAWLVRSAALAERTGVSRNVFFALAHAGVPLTLGAVLGLPSPRVRAALTRAQDDNVVPPWGAAELDVAIDTLARLALDSTYRVDAPRESLLGRLFEHAGVTSLLPRQFVESYLARAGTIAEFWTDFARVHGEAGADAVQFTLHAAALTGNHVPLVASLQRDRTGGRLPSLRAAARRSAADWRSVLRGGQTPIGAPVGFPGADEAERVELYATTLERAFEHAFPTEVTAAARRGAGGPAQVLDFVERNPAFDFDDSHIATFLAAGAVLPPASDANLARDLRVAQRLHAVVPPLGRRSTLAALSRAGVGSARQIHNLGLGGLAHRLQGLDREVISRVHERASQAAAKATTLFMKHGAPAHAVPMTTLTAFIPPRLPTVAGLLGRMDFCTCTSCRSIYSPAAYLADILRFLEDRGLLEALVARIRDTLTTAEIPVAVRDTCRGGVGVSVSGATTRVVARGASGPMALAGRTAVDYRRRFAGGRGAPTPIFAAAVVASGRAARDAATIASRPATSSGASASIASSATRRRTASTSILGCISNNEDASSRSFGRPAIALKTTSSSALAIRVRTLPNAATVLISMASRSNSVQPKDTSISTPLPCCSRSTRLVRANSSASAVRGEIACAASARTTAP